MKTPKNIKQNKWHCTLVIILVGIINLGFSNANNVWQKIGFGINDTLITCIAVHPIDNSIIYTGTSKGVYRSINRGRDNISIFQIPGSTREVNSIYIHEENPKIVYAATDSGLFKSEDEGKNWKGIFNPASQEERKCLSVIAKNDMLYLGTIKGLFSANLKDLTWKKESGDLGSSPIYFLVNNNKYLYIATDKKVFIKGADNNFQEVLSVISHQINESSSDSDNDYGEISYYKQIKGMDLNKNTSRLYVATSKGVFTSNDYGNTWQRLSVDGLPFDTATSLIALDNDDLMIGTKNGVFKNHKAKWKQIYKGIETNRITFLTYDQNKRVYAATEKGLFILSENAYTSNTSITDYAKVRNSFAKEPSIQKVQKMAIKYAEVDPEKIKNWRVMAKRKAWLPTVSLGLDVDKNKTRSDSVYGSYNGGGQDHVGPDDKTFYDNLGWDISMSWDFSDLVWSTDQTTIDSRSKMMVELREDILDQITRLYFERRRLQIELKAILQIEPQLRIDKQMRVEELTALIDALTGGNFSRKIEESNRQLRAVQTGKEKQI